MYVTNYIEKVSVIGACSFIFRKIATLHEMKRLSHVLLHRSTKTFECCVYVSVRVNLCHGLMSKSRIQDDPVWRVTGEATMYALSIDYFRTSIGTFILSTLKPLLPTMTFFVLKLEQWGSFLLACPLAAQWCRMCGVVLFCCLHVGFLVSLSIGTFGFVCICGLLALLPPLLWDRLLPVGTRAMLLCLRRTSCFFVTVFTSSCSSSSASSLRTIFHSFPSSSATTPSRLHISCSSFPLLALLEGFECLPLAATQILQNNDLYVGRKLPKRSSRLVLRVFFTDSVGEDQEVVNTEAVFVLMMRSCPLGSVVGAFLHLVFCGCRMTYYLSVLLFSVLVQIARVLATRPSRRGSANGMSQLWCLYGPSACKWWRVLLNLFALYCSFWSIWWCVSWHNNFETFPPQYQLGVALRLDQVWTMFAPRPPKVCLPFAFSTYMDMQCLVFWILLSVDSVDDKT